MKLEKHDGLEVKEIKHPNRKHFKCNELLPQPPFMLLMAAPRYSGKTNLLINMLIDNDMYCKKFDEIFVWSKSYHNDNKWRAIHFDKDYESSHVFEDYNDVAVKKLFNSIRDRSKKKQKVEVLFIFDDMIADNIQNSHKIQVLDAIAATGRHFDISAIIIFQKFMKFTPIVRENATNIVIFEQKNSTALEVIADEYKGAMTKKQFYQIYQEAIGEPFSFLHINLQVPEQEKRFRKNWNTIIYSDPDPDAETLPTQESEIDTTSKKRKRGRGRRGNGPIG
jgi:hypothetical protein